jgi:hypothetical protein
MNRHSCRHKRRKASRIARRAGKVLVADATAKRLSDRYCFGPVYMMDLKGKGPTKARFLLGRCEDVVDATGAGSSRMDFGQRDIAVGVACFDKGMTATVDAVPRCRWQRCQGSEGVTVKDRP